MKVCWTHQNMQQWSHCQGRWSVFTVDWVNERGKERGRERKCEGEREGWLYHRRVLTISSLPHHRTRHKMATPFLLATSSTGGGRASEAPLSHLPPLLPPEPFLIFMCWIHSTLCSVAPHLHFFFYWEWGLFNFSHFCFEGQFNVLVNYNIAAFNFRPKSVNRIYLWWSCTYCIKNNTRQGTKNQKLHCCRICNHKEREI